MRRLVLVVCLLATTAGCLGTVQDGLDADPDATDGGPFGDAAGNGTLSVHAIDVGQADATLVVGPEGETMLVDTGDWRDDGEAVIEYLEHRDVDRIDHLVSTHAHADHVGGAAAVIEHYETEREGIGAVYDSGVASPSQTYESYLDAIEAHDVTLYRTQAGDEIPVPGAHVAVLNPPADADGDDLHEHALVVHVAHGDAAFLFTGDAEADVEQRLVATHGDDLEATGLQAGHHGSDTSNAAPFLDAVDPAFAIVSAARDSQYGHPHEAALERFAARDVDVYWTGVHGTIVAESDGERVRVGTVVDATTDPTAVRDEPAADAPVTGDVALRETYVAADATAAAGTATVAAAAGTATDTAAAAGTATDAAAAAATAAVPLAGGEVA